VVEKLPSSEPFDLAVRDGKTGFIFFNIEGDQYDYDVGAQLPSITDGRLLISPDFANALGRPSESGSVVGKISIRASMQPVDIQTLVNGEVRSAVMSPLHGAGAPPSVGTVPGPISPSDICPPWSKVEVMEPLSALGWEPILVTTH
jgi:hypothetical protein